MTDSQLAINVSYRDENNNLRKERFTHSFRIGRAPECDIRIPDFVVSRMHVKVVFLADSWWITDEGSSNGIYIGGQKIDRYELTGETRIKLGDEGPALFLQVESPPQPQHEKKDPLTVTQYKEYYFGDTDDDDIGDHTMMVREAFNQIQKKQKKKYGGIIAVVVCLFVIAGSVAVYKHLQVTKQRELAGEIFYTMKNMELEFAELLASAKKSRDPKTLAKVKRIEKKAKQLEESYTQFVDRLEIYEKNISEEEQIILKMARTFGECEIFMPKDFSAEVLRYIQKWKSTKRFSNAVGKALRKGYGKPIVTTLLTHNLPPQFFYLALQESNFNINACGPKTRWGIAKGMWQFIPSTANYYGLKTGPLKEHRKPDPNDERHNFLKSTRAAAKYLRHIYDTDAQASGLLVMASYNWGENRVNRLINEMPQNPRDRNFWTFLEKYRNKMPKETYDYVFYIFSAAVIGENPQLFGFDMDNPLAFVES